MLKEKYMTAIALKKKIHEYVDITDEKILNVVHTILEEHIKLKESQEFSLSNSDVKELDKRWENYKNGLEPVFTISEVKAEMKKKFKFK